MQRARLDQLAAYQLGDPPGSEQTRGLNRFLHSWAGYFRYGNTAQFFDKISRYALMRLA